MFGLMRARLRTQQQIAPRFRRLHYCGTCKTMGRLYGQKSRMLLNHDTVFLAELLSVLSGEETKLAGWAGAYQSFNCLALPDDESEMPVPLQFAATATVVLTEYKVRDHVTDSGGKQRWRWLARWFSPEFFAASKRLTDWEFPIAEMAEALRSQEARESASLAEMRPYEALLWLAEPTARATGLFFAHGARLVGQENCAAPMERLGALLGTVAYVVDAWRDRQKDEERGEFNALGAVGPGSGRELVEQCVGSAVAEMSSLLATLPIPEAAVRQFTMRLRANLAGELPLSLPIVASTGRACGRSKKTWGERWQEAKELAAAGRRQWSEERGERWAGAVFGAVAVLALVSPQQVREAHSVHECLGLGSNLMFWGSVAVPLALCGPSRPVYAVDQYGRPVQVVQQRGGGCGRDCCCCCELCACEACLCEGCCCEECCSNCCNCG